MCPRCTATITVPKSINEPVDERAAVNCSHRRCHIHIDHAALKHNFQRVRELAPHSKIMPVVKADGYGHGMRDVVTVLEDADAFGVAMMAEGVALRQSGCDKPIVVFHGFQSEAELQLCAEHELQPAIHHLSQLSWLENYSGRALHVWLKVDTGMHRLGVAMSDVAHCMSVLEQHSGIASVSMMSHLSNADVPRDYNNINQLNNIVKANNPHGVALSLANSAAICAFSEAHLDWVRPGIMLYGASPLIDVGAEQLALKPVMTFESRLIAIQSLRKGDAIGYGSSWQCPEDMPVGIVAAGYGDGYPRHATTGTPLNINGQRAELVGRVSMDSLYVDLRGVSAEIGDVVELWGKQVAVDEVADCAGTIAYELLCSVSQCQSTS